MKLIYNRNNQINLSQITDEYLPANYRNRLQKVMKHVYSFVSQCYSNSNIFKQLTVDNLNKLAYLVMEGDDLPVDWIDTLPFDNLPDIDYSEIQDTLGQYYLEVESICWDVDPSNNISAKISSATSSYHEPEHQTVVSTTSQVTNKVMSTFNKTKNEQFNQRLSMQDLEDIEDSSDTDADEPTSMDDILLDPGFPYIPIIDMDHPWLNTVKDGEEFVIYTSLPVVPECQADITVSTEPQTLLPSEMLRLYPNHIMKLRHQSMYIKHERYEHLEYDDDLGVILPIKGFSREQVLDNIIKYPDLINIGPGRIGTRSRSAHDRIKETVWEPFEYRMEVDGELIKINGTTWNDFEELRPIPPTAAFRQEYVVRKYLLERDNGIEHSKNLFGTLYPFITLFMPMKEYIKRGYTDVEDMAMKCVKSRVSYFRSRNPMLLTLGLHYNYDGELIDE